MKEVDEDAVEFRLGRSMHPQNSLRGHSRRSKKYVGIQVHYLQIKKDDSLSYSHVRM